jgi:hypothetical protein
MSQVPTVPRLTPCSPPSRTLRAAFGGGLWPSLTAAVRGAREMSGRDEETAPLSRTKKHQRQHGKPILHSLTDATCASRTGRVSVSPNATPKIQPRSGR